MPNSIEVRLVNTIISMYHTTRLKDTPISEHILEKECVKEIFDEMKQIQTNLILRSPM
jgi:hypothetical protein